MTDMPTRAARTQPKAPRAETTRYTTDNDRYEAVRTRDAEADGIFYYAVATTGVYCRPSCPARLALRANVSFHPTPEAAERAGFRSCKRCRPRETPRAELHARLIERARALLEAPGPKMSLNELAAQIGLSPYHFHRLFSRHVGMTPKQYAAAHRLTRFTEAARAQPSVTAAIYEAGYSSSSRFYEQSSGALGMAPTELRRGGEGLEMRAVIRKCALGQVLVAVTRRGVCAINFGDRAVDLERDLEARFPHARIESSSASNDPEFEALIENVLRLVDDAGKGADLSGIPLDLLGTAFQQRVWRALRDIPRGDTVTYSELARRIGEPRAARAVGLACGANPLAVAVPCHRVVRSDGGLGGYRWGLARKTALLSREEQATEDAPGKNDSTSPTVKPEKMRRARSAART
jgi:AraC family transcriptional regulator, regulatory protein of adaptative response / methylated-DNA-[protein]-cysteine methyltransferase